MKSVIIQFDYLHGPLWEDMFNAEIRTWSTGIPVIDDDKEVQEINYTAAKLYGPLYSFNKETACNFDYDLFTEIKPELLYLTKRLIDRLSNINDGSFEVTDKATKQLRQH